MSRSLLLALASLSLFCFQAHAAVRNAVIFDIDDTLVDVGYRTHEILREVGGQRPEFSPLLGLSVEQIDFDCGVTVKRTGMSLDLVKQVCNLPSFKGSPWGSRFFENADYIKFDHVLPGASRFVNRVVKELGAEAIYLSGRDESATGEATRKQVDYFGFPKGLVITQPTPGPGAPSSKDDEFKCQTLLDLQSQGYNIIAAFDDSFDNAQMFRANLAAIVPVIRPRKDTNDRKNPKYDFSKPADDPKNAGKTPLLDAGIEQITDYTVNNSTDATGARKVENNSAQLADVLARAKALKK